MRPVRARRIWNEIPEPKKVRAPVASESKTQRSIIDALRWHSIKAVHVPNGAHLKGGARAAAMLKADGLTPGFPDLLLYKKGCGHGLLEVKRQKYSPSDVSAEQRDCHVWLRDAGFTVEIVSSVDEALAAVRQWGWL